MVKIFLDTGVGEIVELEKNNFGVEEHILSVVDNYLWHFDDPENFTVMECTFKGEAISPDKVLTPQHDEIFVKLTADEIRLEYQFEKPYLFWAGTVKCGQTDNLLKVLKRKLKENKHPETFKVNYMRQKLPNGLVEPVDGTDIIYEGYRYVVRLTQTHMISFEFVHNGVSEVVTHEAFDGDLLYPIAINILKNKGTPAVGQTRIYRIDAPQMDWHSESLEEVNICSQVYAANRYRIVSGPIALPYCPRQRRQIPTFRNTVQRLQNQFYDQFDTKIDRYLKKIAGKMEKSSEAAKVNDGQVVDRLAGITAQLEKAALSFNRPVHPKESEEYKKLEADYNALLLEHQARQHTLQTLEQCEAAKAALIRENEELRRQVQQKQQECDNWQHKSVYRTKEKLRCEMAEAKLFELEQKLKEAEERRDKMELVYEKCLEMVSDENANLKNRLGKKEDELFEKEKQVEVLRKQLENEKKEKKEQKGERKEEKKEEKEENKKENKEKEEEKETATAKDDESSGDEDFDVIDRNFIDAGCSSTYSSAEDN
ncbi:unnamed protein product [Bursaphelenchus xylophilus]|uniref:(pine wood nematode) hypothetical protein n=1 Tax=Bursaphelenchus xylophilus TaxID=6326 RepID=A0A1I7S9M7_BURXY|nr:unnamed protein product [Bursaphelenchus xylophilus]CAG9131926.1 unnamed protein product [Bursaphelenchus xylophilus]